MFDLPIKVYGLKYSSNFSVSMNMISDLNNIIGILCQPIAFLEVLEVEGTVANKTGMSSEEFGEEVRRIYGEEFEFKHVNNTYRDKKDFEKIYVK